MAKKPSKKSGASANAATGATNQAAGATFGASGIPIENVVKGMPQSFSDYRLPTDEAGIQSFLLMSRVDPAKVKELLTSPTGAQDMLAMVNDPNFFKLPPPAAGGQAAQQAAPQGAAQAAAGADKPKKPAKYPKPVSSAGSPRNTRQMLGAAVEAAVSGGVQGGPLKQTKVEILPDGTRRHVVTYFEPGPQGPQAVGQETIENGAVVDSSGSVPGDQSGQPGQSPANAGRSWGQWANSANRPTFEQRLEKRTNELKAGGYNVPPTLPLTTGIRHLASEAAAAGVRNAPFLTTLGVGGTALGLGAKYLMGGGGGAAPPQDDRSALSDEERRQAEGFWSDTMPGANPPPKPQAEPQQPAPNPAGKPGEDSTTLLRRLMQSREYA